MRVAILGGSFDPIHEGHLRMAKSAYHQLHLDEVWFLPAYDAPLKDGHVCTYEQRIAMIELAIDSYSHFKICREEENVVGKNYTIDTIRRLKLKFPRVEFYFLIGGDQVSQLSQWKDIDELLDIVKMCAFTRNDEKIKTTYQMIELNMEKHPASSSDIRSGKYLYLNQKVHHYILQHNLYLQFVKDVMSSFRYEHSVRVAKLSCKIAKANHLDEKRGYIAGLLHDINKEFKMISKADSELILRIMKPEILSLDEGIWHGYMARFILEHSLKINDHKMLEAIENHVLGNCAGSYAKLLYVADKLEPGRDYDTKEAIKVCLHNLNEGYKLVKHQQKEFYGDKK